MTILDGAGGDEVVIVDLTPASVTFYIDNGGTPVGRTVNVAVQGF